jgi:hypothetical protein
MKRSHLLLLGFLAVILGVIAWLFWSRPQAADMASYAPSDSLVYLEANDPLAVINAVMKTDALKVVGSAGDSWRAYPNSWTRKFMKITGIGPTQSVILSRAQMAVVITNLGVVEGPESLTVKPEVALIIETHTSPARSRSVVESALKRLAETTYDKPTFRRSEVNGTEFLEWTNQDGSRRIVSSLAQSVVVVGNSEAAVRRCLDTAAGRVSTLRDDADFIARRREFNARGALTFGYVPRDRSAQLLSFAVPLVLGRAPGDASFQKVVSTGAAKMFGSIAWGSVTYGSGIEDRYLISLRPSLLNQLKPALAQSSLANNLPPLPPHPFSVSYYRFDSPDIAWQRFKTAVSANVDALSAIVFNSLLNSALSSYGIAEPEKFLQSVQGPVLTIRVDPGSDRTMVIARIGNKERLRDFLLGAMKYSLREKFQEGAELFVQSESEAGLSFLNDFVILGSESDVRRYLDNYRDRESAEVLRRMAAYAPLSNLSPIATYTEDGDRVRRFISTLVSTGIAQPVDSEALDRVLAQLPYAATESRIDEQGIERITRSPLGQFSTLFPLVIPDKSISSSPAR